MAYFQPATNTYGPLDRLRGLYEEALGHPQVVGLAIGTRPDCAGEAVLDTLAELSARTWLTIEFGLQTIHDRTLDWLERGHGVGAFLDAARRTRQRGLEMGVHVILGLPGESPADMLATARCLARLGVASVKLHNLYAVRGTRLAELLAAGQVRLPERDEYVRWVVDFLEVLPPGCVIDRLSGDAPGGILSVRSGVWTRRPFAPRSTPSSLVAAVGRGASGRRAIDNVTFALARRTPRSLPSPPAASGGNGITTFSRALFPPVAAGGLGVQV